MKIRLLKSVIVSLVAGTMLSSPVFAQELDPGHPRISEVDQRLQNQENAAAAAEKNGTISATQEANDLKADQHIQNQMNKDAAANGGHITKGEQRGLNGELNNERATVNNQKAGIAHPRIHQVNGRINREDGKINNAEKNGKLTGAQGGRDQRAENRIHRQMMADKRRNGGHITQGEQRRLNREQNRVNRNVHRQERHDAHRAAAHAPAKRK